MSIDKENGKMCNAYCVFSLYSFFLLYKGTTYAIIEFIG
jgi:hypothetical protein